MTRSKPSWFSHRQPRPQAEVRLFCFPYAGGGASIFRLWPQELPAAIDVCPVQLPGRENRIQESPYRSVEPLVEDFGERHRSWFTDLPFAFFGHSMGTLIAFELSRWLRRQQLPAPRHLFMSAHRAPHQPLREEAIHDLPPEEFRDRLRRLNGTPEEVLQHPELMELLEPVLRADFALNETYRCAPDAALDIPMSAFGGVTDGDVTADDLEAWRQHTRGAFSSRQFPGDHFFLHGPEGANLRRLVVETLLPSSS
ncbi:MAG: thioesterase domain-containing protein [Acidobacteriota bacterium]